jgi:hypothetical protein
MGLLQRTLEIADGLGQIALLLDRGTGLVEKLTELVLVSPPDRILNCRHVQIPWDSLLIATTHGSLLSGELVAAFEGVPAEM